MSNQALVKIQAAFLLIGLLVVGPVLVIVLITTHSLRSRECQADQVKYCSLGDSNTMCQYCGINERSCFGYPMRHHLTENEKKLIVDKHNELRSKVAKGEELEKYKQPSAKNMKKLQWNDELAKIAQRWADQCPDYHDDNRKSPDFEHEPGQNIAYIWNNFKKDVDLKYLIQLWYNEIKDFPSRNVDSYSKDGATGKIGHYTQLVWGDTELVGCGLINYKDQDRPKNKFCYTFICNYFPSGNCLKLPVYNAGPTASECQNGSENGLCL